MADCETCSPSKSISNVWKILILTLTLAIASVAGNGTWNSVNGEKIIENSKDIEHNKQDSDKTEKATKDAIVSLQSELKDFKENHNIDMRKIQQTQIVIQSSVKEVSVQQKLVLKAINKKLNLDIDITE